MQFGNQAPAFDSRGLVMSARDWLEPAPACWLNRFGHRFPDRGVFARSRAAGCRYSVYCPRTTASRGPGAGLRLRLLFSRQRWVLQDSKFQPQVSRPGYPGCSAAHGSTRCMADG